ncbi:MAG: hypothetical protein OXG58_10800 [Gemmatimonadetes bacterium]|nr:hypothetical protein [Gemmatimonadota bacterium]
MKEAWKQVGIPVAVLAGLVVVAIAAGGKAKEKAAEQSRRAAERQALLDSVQAARDAGRALLDSVHDARERAAAAELGLSLAELREWRKAEFEEAERRAEELREAKKQSRARSGTGGPTAAQLDSLEAGLLSNQELVWREFVRMGERGHGCDSEMDFQRDDYGWEAGWYDGDPEWTPDRSQLDLPWTRLNKALAWHVYMTRGVPAHKVEQNVDELVEQLEAFYRDTGEGERQPLSAARLARLSGQCK